MAAAVNNRQQPPPGGPSFEWETLDSEAPGHPVARTYFTMCSYAGKLWVFGGFGQARGRFKDLRSYDPKTRVWKVESKDDNAYPHPVYLHSAVVYQGKMWVYGGSTEANPSDVYCFDFHSRKWTNTTAKAKLNLVPAPRFGHAAVVCGNRMIVAGGCKPQNQYHSDAFAFDLERMRWSQLPSIPWPMAYHSLFEHHGQVYLVGGFNGQKFLDAVYRLDEERKEWVIQPCRGPVPQARCGMGLASTATHLYMCQGFTANGHTDDLHRLDLATWTWERLHARNTPARRAYLQAAIVDDELFIFGGFTGDSCVADHRALRLPAQPNMAQVLLSPELDADQKLRRVLETIAGSPDYAGMVTVEQLQHLVTALNSHLPGQLQALAGAMGTATPKKYPFSIDNVPHAVALGFDEAVVLATMEQMHREGKAVDDLNVVVSRLVDNPAKPAPVTVVSVAAAPPPAPVVMAPPRPAKQQQPRQQQQQQQAAGLAEAQQELEKLRRRFEQLKEEKEEQVQCKLCLDQPMDSVFLPCKHLAACHDCCASLVKMKRDCPICRKPVDRYMRCYWG